jgi:hypothetical protein
MAMASVPEYIAGKAVLSFPTAIFHIIRHRAVFKAEELFAEAPLPLNL